MKLRNTFQTHTFLLLLLLAIPALACTTLTRGSDDNEPSAATATDNEGVGTESGEAATTSEATTVSEEASSDSREAIVSALRTGLEIDRMRMHIISEDVGSGQVTDITLAIVRPDRYHLVSEDLELIVVEDTTYLKGPNGGWTTVPGTEMIATVEGTLAAFAGEAAIQERLDTLSESDVIIEGTETINGVETQIYSVNEGLEESSIFGRVKMWIGIEDGRLYRQEVESELSGVGNRATMEFEYGDAVTVEPPEQ
jgi:hypothetical protein